MDYHNGDWVKHRIYVHRSKDTNYQDFSEIEGITEKALNELAYCFYEQAFDLWVNKQTGEYHIDGEA